MLTSTLDVSLSDLAGRRLICVGCARDIHDLVAAGGADVVRVIVWRAQIDQRGRQWVRSEAAWSCSDCAPLFIRADDARAFSRADWHEVPTPGAGPATRQVGPLPFTRRSGS